MATGDENGQEAQTSFSNPPNEAPPAYTPYSSTNSVFQSANPTMNFSAQEKRLLLILGIASVIMGVLSIFISVLTYVFKTFKFCSGTGLWGGGTNIFNGILVQMRLKERNTQCLVRTMFSACLLTILASIASVILSLLGTSSGDNWCCKAISNNTFNALCNVGASQITNTALCALAFVEMVISLVTTFILSKYTFSSCNSSDFYHDAPSYEYLDDDFGSLERGSIRFRMW